MFYTKKVNFHPRQELLHKRILATTSRDIVTAEAHYHRSCYRVYTRPAQQGHSEKSEPGDDTDADVTFSDLFDFIRTDVLDSQVVINTSKENWSQSLVPC